MSSQTKNSFDVLPKNSFSEKKNHLATENYFLKHKIEKIPYLLEKIQRERYVKSTFFFNRHFP